MKPKKKGADFSLAKFIDQKYAWSRKTFGPGDRHRGIVDHIAKELQEVLKDPKDLEEWVDIILLAIDGACRAGYDGKDITVGILSKHLKNCTRQWPPLGEQNPDKAAEHLRVVK